MGDSLLQFMGISLTMFRHVRSIRYVSTMVKGYYGTMHKIFDAVDGKTA
jgi:hypothetical protein